jgi:GNAT superfamily N-acetyltransferase
MTRFLPIQYDSTTLTRYVGLFEQAFPKSARFSTAYLSWLYQQNPDGMAIGFDAWEGRDLVAHYACIPCMVELEGVPTRAMLSLNTATHPAHQGKGLFTQLAHLTYDAAAAQGIQSVFGIANANSTPGFVRKLGFDLIRPLQVKVGWGGLDIDWPRLKEAMRFKRLWSLTSLDWRMANPKNRVQWLLKDGRACFFARAKGPWLPAYAEMDPELCRVEPAALTIHPLAPRLYLGLVPDGAAKFSGFMDIPQRLRPSPLNFIYRSLAGAPKRIDPQGLLVSFLDFDAF